MSSGIVVRRDVLPVHLIVARVVTRKFPLCRNTLFEIVEKQGFQLGESVKFLEWIVLFCFKTSLQVTVKHSPHAFGALTVKIKRQSS